MCIVIYVGSRSPLSLITWREDAPAFNVTELTEHERPVCRYFAVPHVRQAGSHTGCGCGFNEGREYPETCDDPASARTNALLSSAQLARYVREHHVEQIYSCWSGDEGEPRESERHVTPDDLVVVERHVTPDDLVVEEFFFRERELLNIDHDTG